MGWASKTAGNVAKKAGKAAVSKATHKANGGCKGSDDGKHEFTSARLKDKLTGKRGATVTYCRLCGRMPSGGMAGARLL